MIARYMRWLHREHPFWQRASQTCILCSQSSRKVVCRWCVEDLPCFDLSRCGGNLMHFPAVANNLKNVPFEQLLAMAPYHWPYDKWMTQLKFSQRLVCARALAEQFVRVVQPHLADLPQCIWPTPLHAKRLMKRHFNQAFQLAQSIGEGLGVAVCESPLTRVLQTQPQTELSGAQRRRNMLNAFRLKSQPELKHVVLFDDVITTGATLTAQYKLLKAFRPEMRIDIWGLCVSVAPQQLAASVDKTGHVNRIAE